MRFNSNVRRTAMPPLVELPRRAGELAEQGADVIRVDQGAVDVPPPQAFIERVADVLRDPDIHRYSPDPGLPELCLALAHYAGQRLGVECDPERELIVTAGANQGCFAALMALVEPGDEVLLPSPWYFNHAMTLTSLGAVPVPVQTSAEEKFVPNPDAVAAAITPQTRGLVLVNPNNPTGACYGDDLVGRLVNLAIERDLWILSDQTYHELHYGAEPPLSPAAISSARDHVVTAGSFSKSLGLAGWRLGFLAGPAKLVDEVLKIQDCSVICAARAGQEGLLAVLPEMEQHVIQVRDTLRNRRDRLVTSLRAAGFETFVEPGGSLFILLSLPGVEDDTAFCRRLLEEQHVVSVPGSAFGPGGEGSMRLSFGATPPARLDEVVHRIAEAITCLD